MDEWAFVLIVALCIALVAYRIGGDTLAQAILTVAPSRLGGRGEQGPAWLRIATIETKERFAIAILQFTSSIALNGR